MDKHFKIVLNLATIERMLKVYEIGCSEKYKPEIVEKIKKIGGVLLTIDGMRPSPEIRAYILAMIILRALRFIPKG